MARASKTLCPYHRLNAKVGIFAAPDFLNLALRYTGPTAVLKSLSAKAGDWRSQIDASKSTLLDDAYRPEHSEKCLTGAPCKIDLSIACK